MSDFNIKVKLSGKVLEGKASAGLKSAVQKSITAITMQIRNDVAQKIPIGVSGQARAGITHKTENWHRARVFEKGPGTKYIEVLEKGRRPGKRFPPPDPIRLWLRRTDKGKAFVQKIQEKYKLPYDKALERATYLKSMGIAKYGTIAVRMFRTVYKMRKQWAINKVERDIANWTKR